MKERIVVALAGNPNSGKTTLFNSLTGSTAHVGNWPGVTVDKREGTYKKLEKPIDIIDLPGIYSLSPYTPEEVISRNYILDEHPDCVINVVDATNLERNLYLTTQLLETDVPMVIALNMSDVVRKNGDSIDVKKLVEQIGVPVVEISALRLENLDTLMAEAYRMAAKGREGKTIIEDKELSHLISDIRIAFKAKGVGNPLFHAVKLLEMDEIEVANHPDLVPIVDEYKKSHADKVFGTDYEALVADARYKYISSHYASAFIRANNIENDGKEKLSKSDKIDKVLTHKIWALPIFIVIMFIMFHVTFSEDIFFIGRISALFQGVAFDDLELITNPFWVKFFSADLSNETTSLNGIPSIGVFLQSWFGFATGSLINLIAGIMPEGTWYTSLICDGILTGLDSVLSFIPQIMILFLIIAILEDSGYMARIAFILDRTFRRFGLSGKAFIPMLTGFGCSVPAIMATRTLEDEKEKNLTIRLMTCFSCGAKAPIWALLAAVGAYAGFEAGFFVFSIYLIGIIAAIIYALFLKLFSKDTYVSPFIMELPTYHLPQFRNLMAHLWEKLKHYVIKAGTIIAASTVVIWFLKSFGVEDGKFQFLMFNEEVLDELGNPVIEGGEVVTEWVLHIDKSLLSYIGRGLSYLYYPLGWGMGNDGWKYTVSTFTGLIAKEDVIATMAELGLDDSEEGLALIGALKVEGVYAFALYNLFTIPCFAAIGAAHGEQKGKAFWITLSWWFLMSYVASLVCYWILHFCRTLPGLGYPLLALLIALVVFAGIIVARRHKKANLSL